DLGGSMMADISPSTSTDGDTDDKNLRFQSDQSQAIVTSDASDKSRDQKTLRRLAQNREAARKSRLRKKVGSLDSWIISLSQEILGCVLHARRPNFSLRAGLPGSILFSYAICPGKGGAYVQQLESSRMKLTQLEQELQRARQQGIFISSSGEQSQSMSGNGALAFDVEYARWLEEHNRRINELRGAVNSHAGDGELRIIVDGILAHYDDIFRIKGDAAKADVFHILSGMWKTPAERCFLWLGGFRSSELLKLLVNQLEPLTEQQLLGITSLQQSSQQAEDALSQGMEALQQSLAETLAGSLGPSEFYLYGIV
ncbi:hypothetical protein C3L33_05953, partial [Rhododendron williamsianum]